MLKTAEQFPDLQFLVAGAASLERSFIESFISQPNVKLLYDQTHAILAHADAALVTSGTATLETAILNVPEAVCYKGDALSYHIAKRLVKVKFISLVNLVMDQLVIKEYIQYDMTVENLKLELQRLLFDEAYRKTMFGQFTVMREKLGGKGASERTADSIVRSLKKLS
jgi:lipid-A-disaccharide synthase